MNTMTRLDPTEIRKRAESAHRDRLNRLPDDLKERVEHIPAKYQKLMTKSYAGELTPRLAMKAKCLDCVGFEEVRESVGDCPVKSCAIWWYRPYQ